MSKVKATRSKDVTKGIIFIVLGALLFMVGVISLPIVPMALGMPVDTFLAVMNVYNTVRMICSAIAPFALLFGISYLAGGMEKVRNKSNRTDVVMKLIAFLASVGIGAVGYGIGALLVFRFDVKIFGETGFDVFIIGSLISSVILAIADIFVTGNISLIAVILGFFRNVLEDVIDDFGIEGFFYCVFKLIISFLLGIVALVASAMGYVIYVLVRGIFLVLSLLGLCINDDIRSAIELILQIIFAIVLIIMTLTR